jgi:hypothetical protein
LLPWDSRNRIVGGDVIHGTAGEGLLPEHVIGRYDLRAACAIVPQGPLGLALAPAAVEPTPAPSG